MIDGFSRTGCINMLINFLGVILRRYNDAHNHNVQLLIHATIGLDGFVVGKVD